jgi:hypothetical protein
MFAGMGDVPWWPNPHPLAGDPIEMLTFTPLEKPVADIQETLNERGSRYGSFADQGRIEQNIKRAMQDSPNWSALPDDSKSALEMIATKMSRILKGDPEYDDSWRDIAGYATLIVNRLSA